MPRAAKHYRRLLPGASRLLCLSVLQRVRQSCKTSRKLRNGWVVEWEWIFQRKVMFTCRSRSAEFQMTSRLFCVRKQNCWTSRHSIFLVRKRNFKSQDILCAEAELRDLKSQSSCMEAELRNFQVTVFSLCGSGIAPFQSSQVTHYSVCGSGTAEL